MHQESKTPALWKRRPGVTLLITGVVVCLIGAAIDSDVVIALGLLVMTLGCLVGALRVVRRVRATTTERSDSVAKQLPTSRRPPRGAVAEKPPSRQELAAAAAVLEREERIQQFIETAEREALREFVEATLAREGAAEAGPEEKRRALQAAARELVKEFWITRDAELPSRIEALNQEAARLNS